MREHMYRAWDKERNVMVYPNQIYPKGQYQMLLHDIAANRKGLALQHFQYDGDVFAAPNWEDVDAYFMQYTGIKDTDNQNIYEGDILIVQSMLTEMTLPYKAEVVWDRYRFALRELRKNVFGNAIPYSNVIADPSYFNLKIIGNVYENMGLLEEQHG
ncbi:YopX family protein [Aneurinibacillus aneurinilyticus]|uniref:YopX protein domain-containing protein n=1 Tax=Aneurinibacillus aneurinilyticus ATCC 12856 TaxID=649747 RepID=U1X8F5_ANEAE|nr:YopX family protein [Aneurinibacillus aneurinilyticus]ERI10808.1 hypothetical protein HMPREF0083_01064 [Aneurinibacillus aneurinilyticus ATCC 12856]MED0705898.1 YopX family protein [Aneurinibacillus aneurinilyticus]MED0722713.1 YopX family protein [Aneurinibacillus aneurinilyticus]MED0731367.1 YopX family protein [Aneurinibacillus aneurinilyticus]MED0740123.1 YopX family protein [Aneurinibacillus aneurinilyticus]